MGTLLEIITFGYIIPLIITFVFSYVIYSKELKRLNPDRNLSILFGLSVLPAINILLLLVLIGTAIFTLGEEIGKYLIKEK